VLEAARTQLEANTKQPRTRTKVRGGASRPTTTDSAATGERDQPNARQQRLLGKRVKTEPTDSDNDAQHDREHEHEIKHERLEDLKKEEKDEEEEEEKEEDEEGVDEEETEDEETEDESDQVVDDSSSNDEAEEEEEGAERKTKRRRTENSTSGDGAKGGDRGAVPDGLVLREVKLEKASESDAEEPRMDHYYAEAVGDKGEDKRATQGTETERGLDKEASVKMDHDQPATTTTTTNTTGSHDQPQQAVCTNQRDMCPFECLVWHVSRHLTHCRVARHRRRRCSTVLCRSMRSSSSWACSDSTLQRPSFPPARERQTSK
jgi:hypothetical protein